MPNQSFGYDWNDRLNGDQHDNNGNTKFGPVSQPTAINAQQVLGTDDYDSENRLIQRTGTNGSNVTLVYDGDGNRVAEIVGGQTKAYLVDDRNPTGYAQVVEEIVNGVVNHTYTFGHDLISQDQFDPVTNNWKASFYGYDGRGTVRFLTDETGAVTDTYTYDAFGTLITATGSTNNRYLYSGEQWDPNLGLYYLRARLMNPLTGRFWTMDSYEGEFEDPASLHKYLYANADPANNTDPTGQYATMSETLQVQLLRALVVGLAAQSVVHQAERSQAQLGATLTSEFAKANFYLDEQRARDEIGAGGISDKSRDQFVFVWRTIKGKRNAEETKWRRAEPDNGEFSLRADDKDGLSVSEYPFMPNNKPYVVGFAVRTSGPRLPGQSGPVMGLFGYTATHTPQHGTGHWSISALDMFTNHSAFRSKLAQYARDFRELAIWPNPNWSGTPRDFEGK